MRPATFLWFVAHDLRLALRRIQSFLGAIAPVRIALILAAALALFHALAWAAANLALGYAKDGREELYPSVATAALFILPWIVSQALTNATRALYSRGDLDLVLASPMSPRPVFAARSLAIAVESVLSVAIFVLPLADMLALVVDWRWLAIYPTLAAAGLSGTGVGLILALVLFRICGPRRTRVIANLIATLIGAAFAIALQAFNIAPATVRANLGQALARSHMGALLDADSAFWTPVRAAAGEPSALAIWLAASVLVFALAAVTLAKTFANGVAAATGAAAGATDGPARLKKFRAGVGPSLWLKEWRLLTRDPQLASQIFLQIIYTMPISVVLWRAMGPNGSVALATAPALVAVASNVAASLAWLTISSEDAPEFLVTAPVTPGEIERRKLEAVALPVAILFATPVAVIFMSSWQAGAITLFYVVAAATCAALLNLWNPVVGRRSDLLRRHSQSKLVGIIEHLLSLFWALAFALTAFGSPWALAPIAGAIGVLLTQRPRRRTLAAA